MGPAEPGQPSAITVEVVFSPAAREIHQVTLTLPMGATLRQALEASGLTDAEHADLAVGIWGRRASGGTRLKEGDRVEIYRPLTVDPKEARRVRYRAHGEKLLKGRVRPKAASQP